MRMIADILGCLLNSVSWGTVNRQRELRWQRTWNRRKESWRSLRRRKLRKEKKEKKKKIHSETAGAERDITIGELVDIHRELDELSARKMEEDAETEARMTESAEAEVAGSEEMRSEGAV